MSSGGTDLLDREAQMVLPKASEDIVRRTAMWQALADLFLDDEITDDTRRRIARVAMECGYSDDDLDAIYWQEVAPALAFNYFHVAGVWGGFDSSWLQERILKSRGAGYWLNRWILAPVPLWDLRDDWRRIKRMLHAERARAR